MKITLNNRTEILDVPNREVSVSSILTIKSFTFPRIIVKLNGQLIKKNEFDETYVKDGDHLDVIHLISGG